jgi:hypothetical protein
MRSWSNGELGEKGAGGWFPVSTTRRFKLCQISIGRPMTQPCPSHHSITPFLHLSVVTVFLLGNRQLAQGGFEDLPRGVARQGWQDDDFPRHFVIGQSLTQKVA